MTQNVPRQHHIVPAFYLAGFTDTETIDGRLHVFDYLRDRHYSASPRYVRRERDFFRLYEPGQDPYVIEREMAKLEQEYAAVLQAIRLEGRLHRPEHPRIALEMAAFIQARTRKSRQQLSEALVVSMHRKLASGEVTEEQWETLRAAELRAGVAPRLVPPFEKVRDLVVRTNWRPQAPQVLLVGMVGEVHQIILDALKGRDWELRKPSQFVSLKVQRQDALSLAFHFNACS